jgi:hypothetical protein
MPVLPAGHSSGLCPKSRSQAWSQLDRDPVDVAGEVADDACGPGEGGFHVDHPELGRAPECGQVILEVAEDSAAAHGLLELGEQLLSELLDGEEETLRGWDPAPAGAPTAPGRSWPGWRSR